MWLQQETAIALGPMVAAVVARTMEVFVGLAAVVAVGLLATALGHMGVLLVAGTMEVFAGISAVVKVPHLTLHPHLDHLLPLHRLHPLGQNGVHLPVILQWHTGLLNCRMEVGESRVTAVQQQNLPTTC
jgi:hypothetical protein